MTALLRRNWRHQRSCAFAVQIITVAVLGVSLCAVWAEERAIVKSGPEAAAAEVGLGDLYAVLVGVAKYKHPKIPQLSFSDKDAKDFAEFLNS